MITIYHLDTSRSERIVWLMEELDLEYKLELFQRNDNGSAPDALRKIHALGKAPVPDYSDAALTNPSGFTGVTGVFRLNPDGTVDRQLAIIEVAPGGGTVRDPAPGTFAAAAVN